MNAHLEALSIHLASLTPSPYGWLTLDRDRAAADLGVGRIELARILAKAEKSMGIHVESDRVRFLNDAQIVERKIQRGEKTEAQKAREGAEMFWAKYA